MDVEADGARVSLNRSPQGSGDRLPTVALAQARLIESGATDLAVDGIFGPLTEAAVLNFQHEVGVPETKRVDQPTWAALSYGLPISVVDAIDAGDITVVNEDRPYLDDGHSSVVVNYGMSRGAYQLIHDLVASHPARSVALLRLHGHGEPGDMGISSGFERVKSSSFMADLFASPGIRAQFALLGSILKPYGSIELHGCRVALRMRGRRLLEGMARACRVPVTAAYHYQYGARDAARFEGPVLTCFPSVTDLKTWASQRFSQCQW